MTISSIGIRTATPHDVAALADIHQAAWTGAYQGVISGRSLARMVARRGEKWWRRAVRSNAEILVMDVSDVTAGYVTLGPSRMRSLPYKGEIYELYLLPEYQGLGFGSRLFDGARDRLRTYGLKSHALRVLTDNEMACRFYRSRGGHQITRSRERVGNDLLEISIFGWAETAQP